MSEWLLRATIREVRVEYNGLDSLGVVRPDDEHDSRNVVVAVLAYPRSGAAVVTSLREVNLASGETFDDFGPEPTFFDNGLFKEVVQGETALRISISDRERRNPIVQFVRHALGGGLGALLRGKSGRMLGGMVGNLTKALSDTIVGTDQRLRSLTIANTERAQIFIDDQGEIRVASGKTADSIRFVGGLLHLELTAPRTFSKTVLDASRTGRRPRATEQVILERGQPNGHLVLQLEAVPRVPL